MSTNKNIKKCCNSNPAKKNSSEFHISTDYSEESNSSLNEQKKSSRNQIEIKLSKDSNSIKANIVPFSNITNESEIKRLDSLNDLEEDLKDYQKNIFPKVKEEKIKISSIANNSPKRKKAKIKEIFKRALTNEEINNNFQSRENLKKDILYHMQNNSINPIESIQEIFKYNPDRNKIPQSDPNFIFNEPLQENGKTLVYLACQEGDLEVLNFFLSQNLDYKRPCLIDGINETPLEVSCRWNYSKIVQALLEKGLYNKQEICKAAKLTKNKTILLLLKEYITKIEKSTRHSCFC